MTWSVNWDLDNDLEFAGSHRSFLDSFAAVPAQIELTIMLAGSQVYLSWTDLTHSLWYVYRLTTPYEIPSAESRLAVTTDPFYLDEEAADLTEAYYLVTAEEE
ncbi:MAG: hypothetical protein ISR91_01730 [Candidatus Delongbacteria bacterium]|nr:hypothetical protein [bacterium]MBL7032840.1 hypothetical protein [Candidatus Delongbacteria bacterium]